MEFPRTVPRGFEFPVTPVIEKKWKISVFSSLTDSIIMTAGHPESNSHLDPVVVSLARW